VAEPARKLNDSPSIEPDIRPKFGVIDGGGESTPREESHLRSVPESTDNPSGDGQETVANKEKAAGEKKASGNESAVNEKEKKLSENANDSIKTNIKGKSSKSSKKKAAILLIIASLIISVVGAAFLLPSILLKTLTSKLSDAFLGRAQYAIEQRAERYVSRYVNDVIGGTMRTCPGTKISKDCVAINPDKNTLFGKLASNWRDNRLEEKLFRKHGIEFSLDTRNPNKINVSKYGNSLGEFGDRSVSKEVIKTINTESKFDGIMTRRHIRSVLASKYGAKKFCFIACNQRDEFDNLKIRGVAKIKLKIIARVSEISSARMTAFLLCMTTGCSKAELDRNDRALVNEVLSRTDTRLVAGLLDDMETFKTKDLSQLVTRKATANVLSKVGIEKAAASQIATKTLPVVGWIYLGATVAEFMTVLDDFVKDDKISKYVRTVRMQEAALFTTQIISMADDNQSMQAPIEDQWATFQYLNGAGNSRLWQELNGNQNKSAIKCEDGEILKDDTDPLLCPELQVQLRTGIEEFRDNPVVDAAATTSNFYNACVGSGLVEFVFGDLCPESARPRYVIQPTLRAVDGAVGAVAGAIIDGLSIIPPIGWAIDKIADFARGYAEDFFAWVSKKMFKSIINPDGEDQIAFDQAAVGYDVLGNTFSKGDPNVAGASSLAGTPLSPTQQAALDLKVAESKLEKIQDQSFFARYFDFNNADSLVATATLDTASAAMNRKGSIVPTLNPGNFISNLAAAFGAEKRTYAALSIQDRANLAGVTQYGYAIDDPNLSVDLSQLTAEKCEEFAFIRSASAYENTVTGEIEYPDSNPCVMDEIIVDSYTKSTDLDLEGASATSPGGTTNTGASAQYIPDCSVNNGNAQIACGAIDTMLGVPYGRNGSSVAGCNQNPSPSNSENPTYLDCSAFTSMAVYRAFGTVAPRTSVDYLTDRNFSVIGDTRRGEIGNIRDIQPGDMVGKGFVGTGAGGTGHIGIVVSYNPITKELVTVETDSCNTVSRVVTNKGLEIDGTGNYQWAVRYVGSK
jgi:cell wall-associated NlpC family hydrolase